MRHVVRMALTGTTGIAFVFLVDAANLFWLSQLGDQRLVAAIGFSFAIQFASVSVGVGLMVAATALLSRSIGAGKRPKARVQAGACLVWAVLAQALLSLVLVVARHELVAVAGASGETARLAARYLLFTIPSLPLMAAGLVGFAILRAEGDGIRGMYVTLVSGSVSIAVDPLLIITAGLGLDGAAIALVLSRILLMGMALFFVIARHDLLVLPRLGFIRGMAVPYAQIALPAIAAQLSTPFGNFVVTMVIATHGEGAIAAWAVVNRLAAVIFSGVFALNGSITGIFGQNFGAGRRGRLITTYRDAVIYCIGYSAFVWLTLIFFTPLLLSTFRIGSEAAPVLATFTHFGAGGITFMGFLFITNAAFNALGHPARASVLNWVRDGLLTWPAASLCAVHWGAPGAIIGQALASVLVGTAALVWGWHFVRNLPPKTRFRKIPDATVLPGR